MIWPCRLTIVVGLALAASTASPRAWADRTTADFFAQRGDKAAKEKKWAEAQEHYQKALEEEGVHVPARVGLGEAFFGAGDRGAAVDAWRRAVADAEAAKPLPPAWTEPLARARKRLAELDAAGTALAQIVDKQADDLVALATKWAAKDPDLAVRALEDALRLRPGHAKATALLGRLGKSPKPPTMPKPVKPPPKDEGLVLFSGKDLLAWTNFTSPTWRVEGTEMVGEIANAARTAFSQKLFKGDFDVRVEARIVETKEGTTVFGVVAEGRGADVGCLVAFMKEGVAVWEQEGPRESQKTATLQKGYGELPFPFDPAEWTSYEVQFRTKEIRLLVGGREEFVQPRVPRDAGAVGLFIQNVKVAVRRVSVLQR